MKNKKILGGMVVLVIILSGTTVLYLAGVERSGVTPALAAPSSVGCPAGTYCLSYAGVKKGCGNFPCCPQSDTICGGDSNSPFDVPKYGDPGSSATCYKFDGPEIKECRIMLCGGGTCAQGNCKPGGGPFGYENFLGHDAWSVWPTELIGVRR